MTLDDKKKFCQWFIDSGKYSIFHNDDEKENPAKGRTLLEPKNGVGNCIIFYWNAIEDTASVQLYRRVCMSDYDFGTLWEGVDFIDNFYLDYKSVANVVEQLLKQIKIEKDQRTNKYRNDLFKKGSKENFYSMMYDN